MPKWLYNVYTGFSYYLMFWWGCISRKRRTKVKKKNKYTILDNIDEQERMEPRPKYSKLNHFVFCSGFDCWWFYWPVIFRYNKQTALPLIQECLYFLRYCYKTWDIMHLYNILTMAIQLTAQSVCSLLCYIVGPIHKPLTYECTNPVLEV